MQYMTYQQGTKVMDKLAENVMNKIQQRRRESTSMMALYQEWMNISDKSFVSLFESDDYSKVMAEVSALQLKLRKDMETANGRHAMKGIYRLLRAAKWTRCIRPSTTLRSKYASSSA